MATTLHSPRGIEIRIEDKQLKRLNAAGIDVGMLADEAHAQMQKHGETRVQADYGSSVIPFRPETHSGRQYLECAGPIMRGEP